MTITNPAVDAAPQADVPPLYRLEKATRNYRQRDRIVKALD